MAGIEPTTSICEVGQKKLRKLVYGLYMARGSGLVQTCVKWRRRGMIFFSIGVVAQMVERVLSMHEVQGSIPCYSKLFKIHFSPDNRIHCGGGTVCSHRLRCAGEVWVRSTR